MKTARTITSKNRYRKAGINLLLCAAAVLICLLIAEGAVRWLAPQKLITRYSRVWRPDSIIGTRNQENVNTTINSGEGTVRFITDSDGYRINSVGERDAPRGEKAVLFIGDSFLQAIQVENEYTIPQIVKKSLIRKYGPGISVTNTSTGGWNPNHYHIEAKRLAGRPYDLAIIFLYTANDIVCSRIERYPPAYTHQPHHFRFPGSLGRRECVDALLYPINDILECRSHLFVLMKNRTKWLRIKMGLSAYYFPRNFALEMRESPCWDVTADICKSISDEFNGRGIPCLFVLLPTDYQVNREIFDRYARSFDIDTASVDLYQPNRLLKHSFASRSLTLIDPIEHLRRKAEAGTTLYGFIDSHFNEHGHEAVAAYITPLIESYLFVDE